MASLQTALSKTSLPAQSVESHYGAFAALIGRLLGAPPKFLSLAHASPLTIRFFLGAFRLCFRAPYCDMYLLRITPEQRRAALLESSLTHNCPYCIGHAAGFGDMLRGTVVQQCTRRGDMSLSQAPGEAMLKELIHEVCTFPGHLTAETRAKFVKIYGEEGYTQVAAMLSFMGFLNFVMSACGMHLESKLLPFAELSLQQKNISVKLRESVLDDGEERLGEEEVAELSTPLGFSGWLFLQFQNVVQCLKLAIPTASALMAERSWFAGIPNRLVDLDAWCLDKLGVLLGVLKNVDDIILKRAIALSLRLVFVDACAWTVREKVTFLYVFAAGVGNQALERDAVALYEVTREEGDAGTGSTNAGLRDALAVARGEATKDRFSAALRYMHACAGAGERLTEDVIEGLLRFVGEHGNMIDLAGMAGHFGLYNRAVVLYPARN